MNKNIILIVILTLGLFGCFFESPNSLNDEGLRYLHGDGYPINYKKACDYFQKSAEKGHGFAQFNLGNCYRKGEGRDQNFERALFWFKKSIEQGLDIAKINYASTILFKTQSEQEYSYALKLLNEEKSGKDYRASFILGDVYHQGIGVGKDDNKAIDHYIYSAEHGGVLAQALLYLIYSYGLYGVQIDYDEAEKWKALAEANPEINIGDYASLEYVIAGLYFNGWGVAKDQVVYEHYLELADLLR